MIDLEDRLTDLLARSAAAVEVSPDLDAVTRAPRRLTRRRSPYLLGLAAAGVAIALAATQLVLADDDPEPTRTTGPQPPGALPRYIVPGRPWDLVHHEGNHQVYGNETGRRLTLTWYPGNEWERLLAYWELDENDERLVRGRTWFVSGPGQVALWRDGDYVFELRVNLVDSDTDYLMAVAEYERVDEETWQEDGPEDALAPSVQNLLVEETIDAYSVPETFTQDQLATAYEARGTQDTIRLEVANSVVCAWVDVWQDMPESRAIAEAELGKWEEWPVPADAVTGEWGGDMLWLVDQMANEELYGVEFNLYTFGCEAD